MLPCDSVQKSVRTLSGKILEGWAQSRTPEGLLYYLNHNHEITQWDHPEYVRIFNEMLPINTVRYAAYRTACKLQHLQNHLKFNEVSLQCVSSAFDCAGLRSAENNDVIPVKEIERVIYYIYRNSFKSKAVDVSLCTDLMVNVILNCYDENRSGNLQVLKCKVLLVVMSVGRLQEKYRYLFNQIADHNNCCTRRKLAKLLQCLACITALISEQLSFGISLVPAAVQSCFKEIEGDIGITEDAFLMWLLQEPQTLVWWTTLYRLSTAELVCHDFKCGVCKQRPMIGLRYQCLKCLCYNLCQDCFLHGRKSRGHKLSHPVQEYCNESTGKEWRRSILKILMHRLRSSGEFKPRYLSISSSPTINLKSLLQDTMSESSAPPSSPLRQRRPTTEGFSLEDGGCSTDRAEVGTRARVIFHSLEALDDLGRPGTATSNVSSSSSSEVGDPPPEPFILAASPSREIYSVIRHLEDGQRQLSVGLDGNTHPPVPPNLLEAHAAELQAQINKLKTILRQYSRCVKRNGFKMPATLTRMESTPIVGDRGLHLSLSPIGTQDSLNDTALMDNKENHNTETRQHGAVLSSSAALSQGSAPRMSGVSLSTIADGLQNTDTFREIGPQAPPQIQRYGRRLPSFTEMNWSDLTSSTLTSSNGSRRKVGEGDRSPDEVGWKDGLPLLEEEEEDGGELSAAKDELEKILTRLQDIIPLAGEASPPKASFRPAPVGVITAAHEIGDAVADFVAKMPPRADKPTAITEPTSS